jgi:hypothetical protein
MLLQYSLGCRFFLNYQIHHALIEFVLFEHAQKTPIAMAHFTMENCLAEIFYGPPVTMQFIFDLLDFSVK